MLYTPSGSVRGRGYFALSLRRFRTVDHGLWVRSPRSSEKVTLPERDHRDPAREGESLFLVRRSNPRGGYQMLNMDQVVRMEIREGRDPLDVTVTASFASDIGATFTGESALRLLEGLHDHSGEPLDL